MNDCLRILMTVTAAFLSSSNVGADSASFAVNQPNIVIILVDDMGFGDPRRYNDQSKIPTPNIDRLATKGMRFSESHSLTIKLQNQDSGETH